MFFKRIIKSIFGLEKKIEINTLPSQGIFYNKDMEIYISKVDTESIIEYNNNYDHTDVLNILDCVKKIIRDNTTFSEGYSFEDIKSVDIVFLFIEIVRFTKGDISISYINKRGDLTKKNINPYNFNYFHFNDEILGYYNEEERLFDINGYKFSIPTIGVEESITDYLMDLSDEETIIKHNTYFYDFGYFVKHKNKLDHKEVDNLIQVFNYDIDEVEMKKINKIIEVFRPMNKYSIIDDDGSVLNLTSKLDFHNIWD